MSDEVFPDSVKDFVFDLHDASRRSFIASEEQNLYSGTFREMTAKVSDLIDCRERDELKLCSCAHIVYIFLPSIPTTH